MVKGRFIGNAPVVSMDVGWHHAMKHPVVILDTGFSGDLQLTPKLADELGLEPIAVARMKIANGQIIEMPTALALVIMEGEAHYVQVQISNSFPLLGINFLTQFSYKAIVNCKNKEVILEKA